jgi:hypothetical protein
MIYDVNKIPDGGSVLNPRSAQSAGFIDPAHLTQFTERRQPTGGSSVSISGGAFYGTFVDGSGSDSGDTFLQGGTVTGGNGGSATIPNFEILSAGALPALISDGHILFLRVACTANIDPDDNVMLPGCSIDDDPAYTKLMADSVIPDPHVFTIDDPTGYLYTEIGRWTATEFLPSSPGNVLASGCIGNFNLSRI